MSFDFPEITPVGMICNTSVYDASITIRRETDVGILRLALQYEKCGQKRTSLIRLLNSRIHKLEMVAHG